MQNAGAQYRARNTLDLSRQPTIAREYLFIHLYPSRHNHRKINDQRWLFDKEKGQDAGMHSFMVLWCLHVHFTAQKSFARRHAGT